MPLWIVVVAYVVVLVSYLGWMVVDAVRRHTRPPVRDARTPLDLAARAGARATALHHLPQRVARVGRLVDPAAHTATFRRPPPPSE